jgi:hypothetical protein
LRFFSLLLLRAWLTFFYLYYLAIAEILPMLLEISRSSPKANSEDLEAKDNFTSAVGRVAKFLPLEGGVRTTTLDEFVAGFPVVHDSAEVEFTYSFLLDLAEQCVSLFPVYPAVHLVLVHACSDSLGFYLFVLLGRQHPSVLGQQFVKLPTVLSHLTEAVVQHNDQMSPELLKRVAGFLTQVEMAFPANAPQLWALVAPEKRTKLGSILAQLR